MNKITTLICSLLLSMNSQAQDSYFCMSFPDFMIDKWYPLDSLNLVQRSGSQKFWSGGANIKPLTGDKHTDKLLKKQAKLIKHCNLLYINCRDLSCQGRNFGNWYAPAFIYERDYILFIAPSIKAMQRVTTMSFMFGAIGGAIAASNAKDDYMCYVLNPSTETVEAVDKKMIMRILAEHQELQMKLQEFDSSQRYSPEVILPILHSLGLIEKTPNSINK
jgi:hypothetical protein